MFKGARSRFTTHAQAHTRKLENVPPFDFKLCHYEAEQANIFGCTTFYDLQPLFLVQRERRIAFLSATAVLLLILDILGKLTTSVRFFIYIYHLQSWDSLLLNNEALSQSFLVARDLEMGGAQSITRWL